MLAVLFVPLAALAAAACFYYAYHWLKTPFLLNVFGAVCAFLAVFCLGGAYIPRTGPWAYVEDPAANTPFSMALEFSGIAVLAYVFGYMVRALALKAGHITDADDEA